MTAETKMDAAELAEIEAKTRAALFGPWNIREVNALAEHIPRLASSLRQAWAELDRLQVAVDHAVRLHDADQEELDAARAELALLRLELGRK